MPVAAFKHSISAHPGKTEQGAYSGTAEAAQLTTAVAAGDTAQVKVYELKLDNWYGHTTGFCSGQHFSTSVEVDGCDACVVIMTKDECTSRFEDGAECIGPCLAYQRGEEALSVSD
jgi:hypothetical protein